MLHRELYGLPHQKVVFASVVDVQEARKAWMFALIDVPDPRLNR
jgi:Na+(H+)/acetate symporter ActP